MEKTMTIGVVGAGNMGSGIAQKLAQEGLNVIMVDMKKAFVERGMTNIRTTLTQGIERKIFTQQQVDGILSRITGTAELESLAQTDFVIEVIFEDQNVKKELFANLDRICAQHTILATNTSSFYVAELAKSVTRPDRFIGMHYFYHPAKNRLLEIIAHEGTSTETIDRTQELARLHGKTAILVKDSPGFAVNRFFVPLLTESVKILEEGLADIPTIEEAAKGAFEIGMGPFELMNVTGIPIAVHASTTFGKELGRFYDTPALLKKQSDNGQLWDMTGTAATEKFEVIQDRLYGGCLGAAAALVSEGVASIEDTDRGAKVGLRWRRGPFEIMNRIGINKAYQVIKAIADSNSDFNMPEIVITQKTIGEPFTFRFVDLEIRDAIAYISINRPEAMNALNEVTVEQLDKAFSLAEKDHGVKAIVIAGAGKAFVAGADIRFFVENIKNSRIDNNVSFTKKGHDLFLRIENAKKPTIAVLDGLSLGGGSELALACQAIVATPAGSMGFPETAIGIYPGLGGMFRMQRQVGSELAKYYVFTGKPISAQDALELGIVTRLVSPQDLSKAIKEVCANGLPDKYRIRSLPSKYKELAQTCTGESLRTLLSGQVVNDATPALMATTSKVVSRKAPLAIKKVNELIELQDGKKIPQCIEIELNSLVYMFSTEDALSGLTSVGKKPPQYVGR